MGKRKSYYISRLQSELRARALKAKDDEELSSALWRMYYKALNAEHEVRAMVMDAEMLNLLKFIYPNGVPPELLEEPPLTKPPEYVSPPDDDDDEPKQKSFWD